MEGQRSEVMGCEGLEDTTSLNKHDQPLHSLSSHRSIKMNAIKPTKYCTATSASAELLVF